MGYLTWNELRIALNHIPEDQMDKPVVMCEYDKNGNSYVKEGTKLLAFDFIIPDPSRAGFIEYRKEDK